VVATVATRYNATMFRKLVKALIPKSIFKVIEPYGHLVETVLAEFIYGFPARGLKVIGVTGTDGKTTTTIMTWTMLKEAGYNAGYMSTVGYGTPRHQVQNHVHMTSLQAFPLMRRIRQLRREGIEWLVLETTSHALAQNRVWGIPYSVAVMTNVNHEHLDYHGSFENYRAAKQRLFELAGGNRRGLQVGVVNADDPSAALFAGEVPHPYRYGVEQGDVLATNIKSAGTGTTYQVEHDGHSLKMKLNIPGTFNVYNSLAAACVGFAVGLTDKQIEQGIEAVTAVEGRMTPIDEGQDFTVIVDFAHTPDSFEKLLSDMRTRVKPPHRLIVLFGSAGRRDESKRAIQGRTAGKYGDLVVVTEEDDRDIDGVAIAGQIAEGVEDSGKLRDRDLFLIGNRTEAIHFAIKQAKRGDTVMLLGKGHEQTIERADGEHPWNEFEEAREAIRAKLSSK
jgi:UDP-N-acetylmuramoyl-L-alanyl-D-glutamate--2,6-diaminopimelate ligase